mgnify:CR=1 FL=1
MEVLEPSRAVQLLSLGSLRVSWGDFALIGNAFRVFPTFDCRQKQTNRLRLGLFFVCRFQKGSIATNVVKKGGVGVARRCKQEK